MREDTSTTELYTVFVNALIATEQRRQQASTVYLSIISAGAAILGVSNKIDPIFVVIAIVATCLIWFTSLVYFRSLSKTKFKVISKMESKWKIKPFALEWKYFKKERKKNIFTRIDLTYLEMLVPLLIGLTGLVYLILRIIDLWC